MYTDRLLIFGKGQNYEVEKKESIFNKKLDISVCVCVCMFISAVNFIDNQNSLSWSMKPLFNEI